MSSIIVVGSVNLDIVAVADKLPKPGETVTGATLSRYPGGKGANQALAARRLGADVKLIADVGDDAEAEDALSLLREGGVDLSKMSVSSTSARCSRRTTSRACRPSRRCFTISSAASTN